MTNDDFWKELMFVIGRMERIQALCAGESISAKDKIMALASEVRSRLIVPIEKMNVEACLSKGCLLRRGHPKHRHIQLNKSGEDIEVFYA